MNDAIKDWLNSQDSKEYFELVKFPSVGADPKHLADTTSTAMWLKSWLEKIGAETELVTEGFAPPILVGKISGDEGKPSVLLYGHYDVQPADPIEEWKTPPFEPTVIDGRVYARGAQDDKGQLFAFLCGVREYIASHPSHPTIKFCLEGQEESGSTALIALANDLRKKIASDLLLVCDTSAANEMRPAIVAGLRGVSSFTIRLKGPNRDLHSGEYGGIAPNTAQAIAELVASLHNPDGSIAVAGFKDGIEQPSFEENRLAELGMASEEVFREDIGCEPVGGQVGKTLVQRNSFEPTIEVNGIHSGYGGPGGKTVIPAEAIAKISMRLVPGQTPKGALDAVRTHLENHVPRGMKMTIEDVNPGAGGFRLPVASPIFRLAEDVLKEMDARGPVFQWDGASIPVISVIKEATGAAPLIVGWGQAEDHIHSPNESYGINQFLKAKEWAIKILGAL